MIDDIISEDIETIKNGLKKDAFEGKRALVTGSAGFIGSWICDVLVGLGSQVVAVDDFSTGRKENISHLMENPKFKLVEGDVCAFQSKDKFNFIFHLAGHASPEEYQTHPIETLQASSSGTANIAEIARKNDATLLFTSTSEVYGDAEVVPTPETYWGKVNPIGPRSCYDEGKRYAEALLSAYCNQHGLDVRIPRIFNTYGPRLREDGLYGRALSRFIMQSLSNQPITVYGDGTQTRSFCYVTDTVNALIRLPTGTKLKGETFNIGNSQEITILELANKIKQITKCKSEIKFHPLPKDDPKRRCPDTSKLEKALGWRPKVPFDKGLKRTINWFQSKSNL
jgi:UDP-glucuronate decarboxylase